MGRWLWRGGGGTLHWRQGCCLQCSLSQTAGVQMSDVILCVAALKRLGSRCLRCQQMSDISFVAAAFLLLLLKCQKNYLGQFEKNIYKFDQLSSDLMHEESLSGYCCRPSPMCWTLLKDRMRVSCQVLFLRISTKNSEKRQPHNWQFLHFSVTGRTTKSLFSYQSTKQQSYFINTFPIWWSLDTWWVHRRQTRGLWTSNPNRCKNVQYFTFWSDSIGTFIPNR